MPWIAGPGVQIRERVPTLLDEMARRRRKAEEHGSHEAWAIPYGDLITLLLAFFVVMYSISSVNEGKFRVLSESMVAAFRGAPMSPEPIQIGAPARAPQPSLSGIPGIEPHRFDVAPIPVDRRVGRDVEGRFEEAAAGMARIGDEIEAAMGPLIDAELIRVARDMFWIEVEINTSLLFASGSAELFPDARPVLERLAGILVEFPVRVHAEGFTDDVPIDTPRFPSNWELSAGRASSVIRLFAEHGLDPRKMAAVGFGEHRPTADNTTPEGRSKNRKVTVVILAEDRPRSAELVNVESLREDIDRGPTRSPGTE